MPRACAVDAPKQNLHWVLDCQLQSDPRCGRSPEAALSDADQTAKRFLQHLFRGASAESRITISYPVPKAELAEAGEDVAGESGFAWRSVHAATIDDAVEAATQGNAAGLNVYVGLGARRDGLSAYQRGKKADVAGLGAVWLDLDIGTKGHASKHCPPDEDAALEILRALPRPPSMVVDSGGGYHVYWLLDGPADAMRVEALCRSWEALAIAAARAKGWHVDHRHDASTVLRVPGTSNRKPGIEPRPVTLEAPDDPPRYAIAELEGAIGPTYSGGRTAYLRRSPPLPRPRSRPSISAPYAKPSPRRAGRSRGARTSARPRPPCSGVCSMASRSRSPVSCTTPALSWPAFWRTGCRRGRLGRPCSSCSGRRCR
jgi:hypothetical protein